MNAHSHIHHLEGGTEESFSRGRSAIAEDIERENAPGLRVMQFAHGLCLRMARRLEAKGYRPPAPSAIDDAEGAVVERVCCLWARRGVEAIDWSRAKPSLARHCGRIAVRFLTRLEAGMTGRKGTRQAQERPAAIPLTAHELELERAALQAWAQNGGAMLRTEEEEAALERERESQRRAASRWIWSVLVEPLERDLTPAERRHPARQAAGRSARARATLVIRLIHADSMSEAAACAGFASARSAAESLRRDHTFERLAAAVETLPHITELRRELRARGLAAANAVRQERLVAARRGEAAEQAAAAQRRQRAIAHACRIKHELRRARESLAAQLTGAAKGLWAGTSDCSVPPFC
jgi:hypothetical protein